MIIKMKPLSDEVDKIRILKAKSDLFNHNHQIDLCSKLLEFSRNEILKDEWGALQGDTAEKVPINRLAKKKLIKTLIRLSSESTNYLSSIDFITSKALARIKINERGTITYETKLSHEHMVPCEIVFKEIINSQNEISIFMKTIGFRALIDRGAKGESPTEHAIIDAKFKSKLPLLPPNFPIKFYPFARYEAAGLFCELRAVSQRGLELLTEYKLQRSNYLEAGRWKVDF